MHIHAGAVEAYLKQCQDGSDMVEVKNSEEFHCRYQLDEELLSIEWSSEQKMSKCESSTYCNINCVAAWVYILLTRDEKCACVCAHVKVKSVLSYKKTP